MILEDAESWSDDDTEAVVEILRMHGSAFAANVAGALEEGLLEVVPGERIAALYDFKVIQAAGERPSGMHGGGTGRHTDLHGHKWAPIAGPVDPETCVLCGVWSGDTRASFACPEADL